MSMGVNLLAALVKRVAQTLDEEFDIEILEMHHNKKIDAPSGTALMFGRAAAAGPRHRSGATFGARPRRRDRRALAPATSALPRCAAAPWSASTRVIFAGPAERIELTHRAEDRMIFARGALHAALWARGKKPGLYSMADVLGLKLTFEASPAVHNRRREAVKSSDRLLVLVRHGESEWNLKNLFTGWRDVGLTEKGIAEARAAGQRTEGARACISMSPSPRRWSARSTRSISCSMRCGRRIFPCFKDQALNERDYGDLSGLNKDDARKKWGAEQVHVWRRSYDVAPPGGESLKDTAARVLPYYIQEILPRVLARRATCSCPRTAIRCARWSWCSSACRRRRSSTREIATGVPLIYRLNADSTVAEKQELAA